MIKAKLKNSAKKIFKVSADTDLRSEINVIQQKLDHQTFIIEQLSPVTFVIEKLTKLLANVENYQPVYGLKGVIKNPARTSDDRCKVIHEAMGDVAGSHVLDIGASLGYLSFYLADRGATVEAWEVSPQNAEVAQLISHINGIPAAIKTKELNLKTAQNVPNDMFDAVMVLSVFHHIIRFQGLEETQKMVKILLQKAPVLFVELAKKGEDPSLPWDESQPQNELDIFKGLDVEIQKIGSFGNHLSKNERPLYMVKAKKVVEVNDRPYIYETITHAAYEKSPLRHINSSRRVYYFSREHIIKEYGLGGLDEKRVNVPEAQTEIATLTSINKLKEKKQLHQRYPTVLDFEVTKKYSRTVIKRDNGVLLSDLPEMTKSKKQHVVKVVLKDVLSQLAELQTINLFHNDVRPWNIIYDEVEDEALLIDFGNASRVSEQDDVKQLMRSAASVLDESLSSAEVWNSSEIIKSEDALLSPQLAAVYEQVKSKNTDPKSILLKTKL